MVHDMENLTFSAEICGCSAWTPADLLCGWTRFFHGFRWKMGTSFLAGIRLISCSCCMNDRIQVSTNILQL